MSVAEGKDMFHTQVWSSTRHWRCIGCTCAAPTSNEQKNVADTRRPSLPTNSISPEIESGTPPSGEAWCIVPRTCHGTGHSALRRMQQGEGEVATQTYPRRQYAVHRDQRHADAVPEERSRTA